jgi:glycosyltransferase involved in cell wall biosynthesis
MSALGVPCVTSLVSPYKEIATEHNGVFIKNNNPRGWVRGISLLIEDAILRANMGGYAQRYVEKNFDAKKNAHLWTDAYMTLLEKKKEAI